MGHRRRARVQRERLSSPTATRGGYFESTFAAVNVGDILFCYVKAPAQRWVGALRIESEMFLDHENPVWGRDDKGQVRYPARFRTSPVIALDVERGLPVQETVGVLQCMDARTWSGLFRRSLTKIPHDDGEKLLDLLSRPREPVSVRVPRRRPRRIAKPMPTEVETPSEDESAPERPTTPHTELIWKLITLGEALGCDVWVASDERGRSFEGESFADHILAEFPSVGLDPESRDLVRSIDEA